MHQKVLTKIENPDKKEEFSYHEIWMMAEEGKERDKIKKNDELKKLAWNVKKVPMFAKEAMIKMIDNEKIDQKIIEEFKKHKDEMQLNFPDKLKKFVFKYIEEHDLQNILNKQLDNAYRKVKFDQDIYYEAKSIILGKRKYVSQKFKDWLDELLGGAISYTWKNEIIRFFMDTKKEFD